MDKNLLETTEALLRSGQYADAEKQLREILAKSPDDWQAQMLFGTCRLFQGDMEGAEKIHRMLEQHYAEVSNIAPAEKTFWEKYHNWIIYGTIAGGLLVLTETAVVFANRTIRMRIDEVRKSDAMRRIRVETKYGGQQIDYYRRHDTLKYGGAEADCYRIED